VRMGTSLAFLRYNKYWKPFEKYRAEKYLMNSMGQRAYKLLWEPLMKNKLGKYSPDVSLAWFWARIYKRTSSLTYPEGGFLRFAERIAQEVTQNKGKIYYNSEILNLESKESPSVTYTNQADLKRKTEKFDAVIVTLPISLFIKIAPSLPKFYVTKNASLKNIAAVNTVLRLNKPLFGDGTYWLSMCDINSPILAIVEHTNFMDKKHYNNEHLVYLGNYLETNDPRYTMSDKELLSLYDPWIKKINPDYASSLIAYKTFHAPFAQPIIFRNYSKNIPSTKTPLKNVHLANIQQVYPWDRGTNYAVELGEKIAHEISKIQ
ncbi:MAG: FAD-dependent oxidoreductase, partial [Candidatus Levybacteria bacterium]|nr:FAD-dependent oxidoreductase [Candidatus Levybacteria bacterium]